MKKILKTAAAALAGILAIGLAACTEGNDAYAPEVPTFFKDFGADTSSSSVTAEWDFSTNFGKFKTVDTVLEADKEIEPSNKGKGATLKPTFVKGKYNDGSDFQLAAVTATLNSIDSSYYFTLTLDEPSNIQITAKGAGAKDPKRLIAIVDKDGNVVGRDNYESNTTINAPTVKVKGAPAGEYKLYANGVRIVKIDASAKSDFTDELTVEAIMFMKTFEVGEVNKNKVSFTFDEKDAYKDSEFNPSGYYAKLNVADILKDSTISFLPSVYSATRDADGNLIAVKVNDKGEINENGDLVDLTSSAEWTVEKPEIVKVDQKEGILLGLSAGTTKVRARVGMFIAEFVVEVSGSAEFELTTTDSLTIEAVTGRVNFKATTTDSRDITDVVTWEIVEASDTDVATVEEGKVIGLKEGTLKVKASFTQGDGTKFEKTSDQITVTKFDKILVTLLDTESKNFPDDGDSISTWDDLVKDTTSVKNATDLGADFTMSELTMAASWKVKEILSNIDGGTRAGYPGIIFVQTSKNATMQADNALATFTVTVTPPTGKTLKLASVAGSFRANKKKITAVKVNGTDYKDGEANKDQRNFFATFDTPLSISSATEIEFELDYEAYTGNGDNFSIGDIKLFFEKEN